MPQTLDELRQWLTSELPKWLKEHPELRDTLESVLSDVFVRKDEWHKVVEALERLAEGQNSLQRSTEELQRTTREMQQTLQEILSQQAEHSRILREHGAALKEHTEILREHSLTLREHSQAIKAMQEQLAEQGRILQEHTEILREHSLTLREHSQAIKAMQEQLAEQGRLLQEHSRILQEHSEILQEHSRILQEHSQILQEHSRILQEHSEILKQHSELLIELREGQRRHDQMLDDQRRAIWRLEARIGALGRRWGMESEATFREAMYRLLTPLGYAVERFIVQDEEGIVFGRPDQVEIDLLIRNDEVIAAEIRASVSKSDVAVFLRKLKFAEQVLKRTVTKKVIISPFVDDNALRFAQEAGIEVYELPDDMQD